MDLGCVKTNHVCLFVQVKILTTALKDLFLSFLLNYIKENKTMKPSDGLRSNISLIFN